MSLSVDYINQVELLIKVLPVINQNSNFALKGGTAINLFFRNMPRLSVDIDLTYLPIQDRKTFLQSYSAEMLALMEAMQMQGFSVRGVCVKESNILSKILVQNANTTIKVEPNLILRGAVFKPSASSLCEAASKRFSAMVETQTLSFADVYGGKICAALARQHPRDLFDIKLLLENEGLTNDVRQAFCIYLASSPRPMHEILNPEPNLKNLTSAFQEDFYGMTENVVALSELQDHLMNLVRQIHQDLTENERIFLLSIKLGEPEWGLINIENLDKLPGLQWKLFNIRKMDPAKRKVMTDNLKRILEL